MEKSGLSSAVNSSHSGRDSMSIIAPNDNALVSSSSDALKLPKIDYLSSSKSDIKEIENKINEYDSKIIPGIKEKINMIENEQSNKSSSKPNARFSSLEFQQILFELKVELEIARAERVLLFEELENRRRPA